MYPPVHTRQLYTLIHKVTQLTDRVTTTERQLVEARQGAKRSTREATNLRNTLEKTKSVLRDVREKSSQYRDMSLRYTSLTRQHDTAQLQVTLITRICMRHTSTCMSSTGLHPYTQGDPTH